MGISPNNNLIKKYRQSLGEKYNELTDQDVLDIATQIKAFIHPIINNYLDKISGEDENYLSSNRDNNA